MFKRLINWLKALFNSTMNTVEDPKLMLKSELRNLSEKKSKLNTALANVVAEKKMKEKALFEITQDYERQVSRIKALANEGQTAIAEEMSVLLVDIKTQKETLEQQVKVVQDQNDQLEKAIELANTNIKQLQEAIESSINESRIAEIHAEVASTMESFEANDEMFNIQEMKSKLDTQNAQQSARLDVALENQKGNIAELEADKALRKAEGKAILDDILKS